MIMNFIKTFFSIIVFIFILLLFSACSENQYNFTRTDEGNLIKSSGAEYEHLANEGELYYLGELTLEGRLNWEDTMPNLMANQRRGGVFSIKDAKNDNVLIRSATNSEWYSIYRRADLPKFNFSVDNCSRLEMVLGSRDTEKHAVHTTCGDGIVDKAETTEFLSDIRSQKNPDEAGLYNMITKPDGMLENCYVYAVLYGFFEEESDLAVCMPITSYNDLAYSIAIEDEEYVLLEKWRQRLRSS